MPSRSQFEADLKDAMRSGDDVRKRTLRMVLSAVKLAEVEKRGELDEAGILSVLQKEVKARHETIQDSERAARPDLAEASRAELAVLQSYLPQPIGEEELNRLVRQAIEETGATAPAEQGKVMKVLMPRLQGRADGKAVSELVRQMLVPS